MGGKKLFAGRLVLEGRGTCGGASSFFRTDGNWVFSFSLTTLAKYVDIKR